MKKIFLVEDEKMVADVIARFFEKKGFEVDVAYDLPTAMDMYDPEAYDLVLLDINLREDTSFPLLERIKKEHPEIPVLIFSGYDSEENIKKAKSLGADGFIPKPFRIEFLKDFLFPKIEAMRRKKPE
ncbi:MAG: response regulator [Candidatus Omnitrophica bacterium]|nr:response regulator [Candidatus Omnitrophota bacterium]